MERWKVRVTGGELNEEVRSELESADFEATVESAEDDGFTVSLEADDSAMARQRVEQTLAQVEGGGYSAGAARRGG